MPDPLSRVCYATVAPGCEAVLAAELARLGLAPGAREPGGISFAASANELATALLWLRSANRVTVRVASFRARTFAELERHAARIDWTPVLDGQVPVHFRVTSKKSRLYHQDAIAERLERSVGAALPGCPAVRGAGEAEALEEDVALLPGVQRIVVRVLRDEITLSADASGALLHRRGYRLAVAKAPLRETLAATLLLASGWTPDVPLLDPMCGSGTIPIEAALIAARIAPGRHRRFAAERWAGMSAAFSEERAQAATAVVAPGITIAGQDRDDGAITASLANASRAGVGEWVTFRAAAISDTPPEGGAGWIVTNPPYGARVGERDRLRSLYATLGQVARARRPRWSLAMIGADRVLDGQVGVEWQEVLHTENGGIPIRMLTAAIL